MSTRSTIWYGGAEWHFFTDGFDDWNVYIEFPREALTDLETIRIPLAIWTHLRESEPGMLRYLSISPEKLKAEAEHFVDERAKEDDGSILRLRGAFRADPNAPRNEQIRQYIESYTPPNTA